MADNLYGYTAADVAVDAAGNAIPDQVGWLYTAAVGGVQFTATKAANADLTVGASTAGIVTADASGRVVFYATDTTQTLWIDWFGGERWPVGVTKKEQLLDELNDDIAAVQSSADGAVVTANAAQADATQAINTTDTVASVVGTDGRPILNNVLNQSFPEDFGAMADGLVDDTVAIQDAINTGKNVVLSGLYRITAPLTVSTIGQRITMTSGTEIILDAGYAGDVWVIDGGGLSIRNIIIEGGKIKETGKSGGAATEPGAWTACKFLGDSAGTTACTFQDMQISWPGTAFKWEVIGTGWANANRVINCVVLYPDIMIDCDLNGGGQIGFSGNSVRDLMGQAGNFTTFGIKGLTGRNWRLDSVALWDIGFNPAAVSAQILSTASSTIIFGGHCTVQNYSDSGAETLVVSHDSGFRVTPDVEASAAFQNAGHGINTAGKFEGRVVFDSVVNRPVWATGSSTTSVWVWSDGTTAYTPV